MTSPPTVPPPATLIVGAGRLGTALGEGLQRAGWPVVLVARSEASAVRAGARGLAVVRSLAVAPVADLVLISVPDDAMAGAARALAAAPQLLRPSSIVLHTSGAVPISALRDAAPTGTPIGSLHPMQSVTAQSGAAVLRGASAAMSGDPAALAMAERVAQALGMDPFRLAAGATARVTEVETTGALTGPIARGDAGTVRLHLAALRQSAPHILPLYVEAARSTLRLASRAGLNADAVRAIAAALDDAEGP